MPGKETNTVTKGTLAVLSFLFMNVYWKRNMIGKIMSM